MNPDPSRSYNRDFEQRVLYGSGYLPWFGLLVRLFARLLVFLFACLLVRLFVQFSPVCLFARIGLGVVAGRST